MTDRVQQLTRSRRPSARYLFHLAMAIVGIAALSIGLGGELRIRAGLNALDALNHEGAVALAFALSLGYTFRLIFWERISPYYQILTRNLLSLVLCIEVALSIVTTFFWITQGDIHPVGGTAATVTVTVFTIAGIFCQISTIAWLLRCRRE